MRVVVDSVDHLVIAVTNLDISADWYQRVLGVTPVNSDSVYPLTTFRFGQQMLRLRPVSMSREKWFTADHVSAGGEDLCFLTAAKPQDIVAHLRDCGVAVELGPVKREGAQGEMTSIYCRDPDGSLIEISTRQE